MSKAERGPHIEPNPNNKREYRISGDTTYQVNAQFETNKWVIEPAKDAARVSVFSLSVQETHREVPQPKMKMDIIHDGKGNMKGLYRDSFTVHARKPGDTPYILFYTKDPKNPTCARLTEVLPELAESTVAMNRVRASRFPESSQYPKAVDWVKTAQRLIDPNQTLTATDLQQTLLVPFDPKG